MLGLSAFAATGAERCGCSGDVVDRTLRTGGSRGHHEPAGDGHGSPVCQSGDRCSPRSTDRRSPTPRLLLPTRSDTILPRRRLGDSQPKTRSDTVDRSHSSRHLATTRAVARRGRQATSRARRARPPRVLNPKTENDDGADREAGCEDAGRCETDPGADPNTHRRRGEQRKRVDPNATRPDQDEGARRALQRSGVDRRRGRDGHRARTPTVSTTL
jgi:hypothetical protein